MNKKREYSDGVSEDWLLDYFSGKPLPEGVDPKKTWALHYHISPQRAALLNWFQFSPGARVLEIGAGPGAITEELVRHDIHVTALELSPKRAEINKLRNKDAKNLEVVVGNIQDFKPNQKFDYVVCVGVLEYAGLFIESDDPHTHFLKLTKSFLKSDGQLLLAIENRFGIKYFAGAREDHTDRFFDSLNDYPSDLGLQTFGKQELDGLLSTAGFDERFFYYPHPDYKMPYLIYSDKYTPGRDGVCFPPGALPTPSPNKDRLQLFSEVSFMEKLEKNDLFAYFANSFLVVASAGSKVEIKQQPVFVVQAHRPRTAFSTQTVIKHRKDGLVAIKRALHNDAAAHIKRLEFTYNTLSGLKDLAKYIVITPVKLAPGKPEAEFPYIKGRNLEDILLQAIHNDDQKTVIKLLKRFIIMVESLPNSQLNPSLQKGFSEVFGNTTAEEVECVSPGTIDLNFDNIIEDADGKWHLIDYEWSFDFAIPKHYIIDRTLWWFFGLRSTANMRLMAERIKMLELSPGIVLPAYIYSEFAQYFQSMDEVLKMESHFQKYVLGEAPHNMDKWKLHEKPKPAQKPIQLLDEYLAIKEQLSSIEPELENTKQRLAQLQQEHDVVVNSRGYRTLQKARSLKNRVNPRS